MTETEDRKKPVPEKNIRTSETFRYPDLKNRKIRNVQISGPEKPKDQKRSEYPDRKNRKIRNVQNIRTGRSETSEPF